MATAFTAASSMSVDLGSVPVTAAPLSMSAWVYPTDLTAERGVLSLNGEANHYFSLSMTATTGLGRAVARGGGTAGAANSGFGGAINTWSHIAAVFITSASRFAYHNGLAGLEGTLDRTPTVTTLAVGAFNNPLATFMQGNIAHAAIWNVALSDAEVLLLSQGIDCRKIQLPSMVFYYPGLANVDQDFVTKTALTPTNAPTFSEMPPGVSMSCPIGRRPTRR